MNKLYDPEYQTCEEQEFIKLVQGEEEPEDGRCMAKVQVNHYEELIDHPGYKRHLANELARSFLDRAVRPQLLRNDGFWFRTELRRRYDPALGLVEFVLLGSVQAVRVQPVVYKYVTSFEQIPRDYQKCDFCGGHTKNDARGHCSGCGGPRNEVDYIQNLEGEAIWRP